MRTVDVVAKSSIAAALIVASAAPAYAGEQRAGAGAASIPCSARVGSFHFAKAGPSDPFATFAAAISVSCSGSPAFRVRLHSGNNCRLVAANGSIAYALYADPNQTKPLLDCGADAATDLTGRGSQVFMIYGRTALLTPALRAGGYSDTLDVEVATD